MPATGSVAGQATGTTAATTAATTAGTVARPAMGSENRLVHLVDDEEAIRKSVGFMLRTNGYKVQTWDSGEAFLKMARAVDPGCVVLDVRMPGMDGLTVQRELRARGVALPVIVITGHADIGLAVQAMKAGAIDFIEKPFEKSVLLGAVDAALDRIGDMAVHDARAAAAVVRLARLTPREHQILLGLADGLPNKSIAHDLGISPRTVEVHRANLMSKLGVHSLSEALRLAFAAGIGSEPEGVSKP